MKNQNDEYIFLIMTNNDNEKKQPENIPCPTFFPVLSACTNSLLYHLRQPLINGFPHEQQHEDKYIVTYYNMKGNEKYQSSGSNPLNKQHFPRCPVFQAQKFCNNRENSLYSTTRYQDPVSLHHNITFSFIHAMKPVIPMIIFFAGWGMLSEASAGQGGQSTEQAILAGGCFWCLEADFQKVKGVQEVISGYTGGTGASPTYDDYIQKGHIEVVQVTYDPSVLPYADLLNIFWQKVDPVDPGGQFCDRGQAYSTAIFYTTETQKNIAQAAKTALEQSGLLDQPVATKIRQSSTFYPAEEYHQNYSEKNPIRYKFYRFKCGRDQRLEALWEGKTLPVAAPEAPTGERCRPQRPLRN
jgi:methionine-S-sulfoxide reductase